MLQFTSLTQESQQLPLILSGPILRRTEVQSVTVWLALKQSCRVQLAIKQTLEQGAVIDEQVFLSGSSNTVRLGKHLHVVAVTADAQQHQWLEPDTIYAYDLVFTPLYSYPPDPAEDAPPSNQKTISLREALGASTLSPCQLSYFAHGLPTFALSPRDVGQLRIFHGSCRRIHDREYDALPILDMAIASAARDPITRPHQLFFTGDQIYGDEVAEPFLWAVLQMVQVLVGWQECLLGEDGLAIPEAQLQPGQRQQIAEQVAGFTAGHQGKPEKTRSHLFRFAEYAVSYLFIWSDWIWNLPFPSSSAVGLTGKAAQQWEDQIQKISQFARSQPYVRRALANIPTYMIFDDHDVSDDWNLNQAWCLRVLGKPLGRQVVRNAMLAYALFQGWGNTPDQFQPDQIGAQLLRATDEWCIRGGTCAVSAQQISQLLGLPESNPITDLPQFRIESEALVLDRSTPSLQWHYRVRGTAHEVLVLDTRTQRGYPTDAPPDALPQLLSPLAFEHQLQPLLQAAEQETTPLQPLHPIQLTLVVAPTNIFSLKILDQLQSLGHLLGKEFDIDIGDSWTLEGATRAKLLAYLLQARKSLIVLSGDIHFGGTIHLDYWSRHWEESAFTVPPRKRYASRYVKVPQVKKRILVQFTASAMCNSEPITEVLHSRIKALFPERPRRWVGWEDADELEVGFGWWARIVQAFKRFGLLLAQSVGLGDRKNQLPTPNHPPDWQYEAYWVRPRQIHAPEWGKNPPWIDSQSKQGQGAGGLQRLWNSRWLQTGQEVVGLNNIGLVRFEHSGSGQTSAGNLPDIALHELYWYTPWRTPPYIVSSQFRTSLIQSPFQKQRKHKTS
jgi:hypothetical protein